MLTNRIPTSKLAQWSEDLWDFLAKGGFVMLVFLLCLLLIEVW